MKTIILLLVLSCFTFSARLVLARNSPGQNQTDQTDHESIFDLDQEVLFIPDSHAKSDPYRWKVERNPERYRTSLSEYRPGEFQLKIDSEAEVAKLREMHLFITNYGLTNFRHIEPVQTDSGEFSFNFNVPERGTYYFEIVFMDESGWIQLQEKVKTSSSSTDPEKILEEQGYDVQMKSIPAKAYADHITTFLYEFSHNGRPVNNLQQKGGADLYLASWKSSRFGGPKDFIFAVPRQNLGGPEVAISMVFNQAGRHVLFANFRHGGEDQSIRHEVDVNQEIVRKIPFSF